MKHFDEAKTDFEMVISKDTVATDDAIKALEKAFELGYRDFNHLEYDHDMDILRDLPRYKELVAKYKSIHEEFLRKTDMPLTKPMGVATYKSKATERCPAI